MKRGITLQRNNHDRSLINLREAGDTPCYRQSNYPSWTVLSSLLLLLIHQKRERISEYITPRRRYYIKRRQNSNTNNGNVENPFHTQYTSYKHFYCWTMHANGWHWRQSVHDSYLWGVQKTVITATLLGHLNKFDWVTLPPQHVGWSIAGYTNRTFEHIWLSNLTNLLVVAAALWHSRQTFKKGARGTHILIV